MYLLQIAYGVPTDPAAFDEYYHHAHLPLAARIPGVKAFTAGKCESLDSAPPTAYLLANITFESKEAAVHALSSPEGQGAVADIARFATGGTTMTFTQIDVAIP
jgi:uncharacterized protein (TIGR02118 family)